MGETSARLIEAGFERIRALRQIERDRERYVDPGHWRALNPELSITESPFADIGRAPIAPEEVERHTRQLQEEGYLRTGPLAPENVCARLARGIARLADAGVHTAFAALYDEYYQAFQGLEPLFSPILGEGYRWVGNGLYAYHVPAGDSGASGLTAAGPHRDSLGPDAAVVARGLPTIVNVWIPLNDVSPSESCLYVVPADMDPDYFTVSRDVDRTQINLQAIRAVPAEARAVLSEARLGVAEPAVLTTPGVIDQDAICRRPFACS